jgi:hypothetical protein
VSEEYRIEAAFFQTDLRGTRLFQDIIELADAGKEFILSR